jgi:hypothetical protein
MLRVVSGAHGFGKWQTKDTAKSWRSVRNFPREWHPVNKAVCVYVISKRKLVECVPKKFRETYGKTTYSH